MSNHSFDIHVATEYKSIEIAILVWHFQYWIMKNKRLARNHIEGRTWTYQTNLEIASAFPYWSIYQVERLIKKAVELKILRKGNYNKSQFDRTVWYAFEDEEKFSISRFREMEPAESGNGNREIAEPIPDTLPDTLPKRGGRKKSSSSPPPPKPKKITKELIPYGRHVNLKEDEYEELCKELSKPLVDHYIEQLNNYVPNRKQGPYRDYAAAIRQWYQRDNSEGKLPKTTKVNHHEDELERISEHRDWFRSFILKLKSPNRYEVVGDYADYVQFSNQEKSTSSPKFYYKNADFKETIKQETAKRLYVKRS